MWPFFQDVSAFVLGILGVMWSWISITFAYVVTITFATLDTIRLWAYENPDIVYGVGAATIACGVVALILRRLWRSRLRNIIRPWYWMLIQRPMQRVLGPVRRLHRRWSERNKEKKVAKWKHGTVADIVGDALLEANVIGVLSDQEYRAYMQKVGKALGLGDMVRVSNNKLAIAHRLRNNPMFEKGADGKPIFVGGPKQPKPAWGGKPGEDTVPQFKGLGDDWLNRHLKKTA